MSRGRIRCQYCIALTSDEPNKLKQNNFQNLYPFLWLLKIYYFWATSCVSTRRNWHLLIMAKNWNLTQKVSAVLWFYVLLFLKSKHVYLSRNLRGTQSKPRHWQMLGYMKSGDIFCKFSLSFPSISFILVLFCLFVLNLSNETRPINSKFLVKFHSCKLSGVFWKI